LQRNTDLEPGRCRRTDGKKWRCGRDVVPDQKYCEKHVHRGRQWPRRNAVELGPRTAAAATGSFPSATSSSSGAVATAAHVQLEAQMWDLFAPARRHPAAAHLAPPASPSAAVCSSSSNALLQTCR